MNAKELYEIVKDVPLEVWPDMTFHPDEDQWSTHPTVACRGPVNIHLAEAAFVGAMVRYRVEQCVRDPHSFKSGNEYIVWNGRECHVAPSLIEALAAACKEAKEGEAK